MENNEIKPEGAKENATITVGVEKAKALGVKCAAGFCKHKKYILGVVVLLLIIGFAMYQKNPQVFGKLFSKNLTQDQAKAKITDFIEKNLVAPGTKVEIKSIADENGLYKIVVGVSGQEITSYMSKDGSKFFPQAMDLTQADKKAEDDQQAAAPKEVPKSDAPEVKLFVMSYCPFGTQMVKGMLPVVKTLGSKIKYTMEFVDYAMHGDKEIAENLRQYCIQKTQPTKLSNYLTCFLKKGEGTSDACMASTGVSATQVASCVAQTDSQFKITADAADKTKWSNAQFPPFNVNKEDNEKFGVQGSPTLVINGVEAQAAGRDSANILKTICAAFNTAPKECLAKLSTTSPAAGFGEGTAAAGAAPASCEVPAQ
ncbi:MAG: hypothetical protein WC238_02100 [Parcubacteria group bacterium]|jgi:hypothetical protein